MNYEFQISPPFLFNPLKHHLGVLKEFILTNQSIHGSVPDDSVIKAIKHLGGSVMDIYTGKLSVPEILTGTKDFLEEKKIIERSSFLGWAGRDINGYRIIELSDESHWTLKFHNSETSYIHIFPARYSPHSFRVKANTLKSAVLYIICSGKDLITEEDLNRARAVSGLSPVKDVIDSESITEMIEILRK
jgi:hypothetical protein